MQQKKKLNLSPLPAQTEDYSHYEESVTRWDRIFGALAILLIVLVAVGYIFFEKTVEEPVPAKEDAFTFSQAESSADITETPVKVEQPVSEAAETPSLPELKEPIAKKESAQVIAPVKQISPDELKALNDVPVNKPVFPFTPIPDQKTLELHSRVADSLAQVIVTNKAVVKSILTMDLDENKPMNELPYEVILPEEGIMRVSLYVDIEGLKGKTLFYEWSRNGVVKAKVKSQVKESIQHSYSSKYINKQLVGDWQVRILDAKDIVYASAEFKVLGR